MINVKTPISERSLAYFESIPTPVQVFQHEWELAELLKIVEAKQPKRILEVGTFHGGTLYNWLRISKPGAIVVSVDSYSAGVDNRHLYKDWVPEGVKLKVIAGDSHAKDTVVEVAKYKPYQFVFIDGDHTEQGVTQDWENYGPMIESGGLCALHDIHCQKSAWPDIEVIKLWRRLQQKGYVTQEIVADPDCAWGGIGCIFLD